METLKAVKDFDRQQYGKLCRNETRPTNQQLAPLRCRYVNNNNPFLKLAPFKMEEYSLDPYVVVYLDVLNEFEIEYLQWVSQPLVNDCCRWSLLFIV